ncbi:MAG: relaxase/mobilization nuclease domain-containing protein [Synergistaceae bacterium]|nr:relaxase/mobilization nuclease domain-containing protein [Synergistaceae bacterium]
MITKIPYRRRDSKTNFKALINYCLGITGHEKNAVIHVGMKNLNSPPERAYLEMEGLSYENVRSKNPALHFILSWRSYESPTNEQVDEAVEIALRELNLEDCQSLWALQKDTENLHVHVVVNRISPETFKAVRPAQGWTKKALERAARKIEFTQGWEIEQSGRYVVDSSGNIHEKIEMRADSKLSQKARDIEAHTGSESIERIAKREILPILESADTWKNLHSKLSERGAYLERRGKGAILHFCGTILKLSSVSRKCSLTQLEHRLGVYNAPDENLKISEKSFIKTSIVSDVKNSLQDYQLEKEKYLESKNSAIKNLRFQQKLERESLHDVQKLKWRELKSGSCEGKGRDLNYLRHLVSFIYKKEQLNLRDEQKQEMLELKSHYLQRFPSFKKWLLEQEREEDYRKYRFPGAFILSPAQSGISSVELPKEFDLRDYFPRRGSGGSVLYCRAGKFTADFSDMGKRIVLNKKNLTEESVLSALQLANAKWGATQINGSDEYKALCVSVAVKHGLKIANPDLAAEVERQRKEHREKFFSYKAVTVEEIEKLNLVENPLIYVNPRKDNQSYRGKIVYVNQERGYCVQLVGQRSLFVHRLDKFEISPQVGEALKVFYCDDNQKAKVNLVKLCYRVIKIF